ncbi:hypothetical protein [Methanolapillus africanus]|uniref:hypothetical protein n=1 Tax=Methanolapillus africanus TaxID=3028297 RepID=UPI0030B8E563
MENRAGKLSKATCVFSVTVGAYWSKDATVLLEMAGAYWSKDTTVLLETVGANRNFKTVTRWCKF